MKKASSIPECASSPDIHQRLAELLYPETLQKLRHALSSGLRTALLTGGDAVSRRALAQLALPNARTVSCLSVLIESTRDINILASLLQVCKSTDLILLDLHSDVSANIHALLENRPLPHHAILAEANDPDDVPIELRRVHRLDALISIQPPSISARERTCLELAKILLPHAKTTADNQELADQIIAHTPACGVGALIQASSAYYIAKDGEKLSSFIKAIGNNSPLPYARALLYGDYSGWNAVGGYAGVKKLLVDSIGITITHTDTLNRLGTVAPKGVILHGNSGVGKSLIVKQLVRELPRSISWLYVQSGDIYSRYLGESEERIRHLFKLARNRIPCVIILDDIDLITGTGVERRVLGALLSEMDGVNNKNDGIQIVGTTAKLNSIDAALLRPGRFDRHVLMQLPTQVDRAHIMDVLTRNIPTEDAVSRISEYTDGKTAADLAFLCRKAATVAMQAEENPECVTMEHFKSALKAMHI